jgi:2-polyprenyl-3-methyl-5-hydroxy-6-metoxy-1,4-benzoquinol methylase
VDKVLAWFAEEGGVSGMTICDAGCGTGSLAIPLALQVDFFLCFPTVVGSTLKFFKV